MTTTITPRSALLAALFLTSITTVARAQPAATSFDQLEGLVKPGDRVTVTDNSGRTATGRILNLSPAGLKLTVDRKDLEFSGADVRAISQYRGLSLKKGAAWGFGIGAGLGLLALPATECLGCAPLLGLIAGGIGAGVGVGVSAATATTRVVYLRAGTAATVTLAPLLSYSGHGLLVSLRF